MLSIPGQIIGNKLLYNQTSFARLCENHNGKRVNIVVQIPERSMSQLRMYRAWLNEVSSHTGNETEALHEYLLDQLAPRIVVTLDTPQGKVEKELIKRTSGGHKLSMTKLEMSEYMEKATVLTGYPLPTKEELQSMGYILNY